MKVRVTLLLLSALMLSACGGGSKSNTDTTVTVTISPTVAVLLPSQTQQFTATVTNASNTAVTWKVNGVEGGNAASGTITTGGLYTAPDTIPLSVTNTITAVSQADTTKSATASVVLSPPPPPYTPGITVSPSSATLPAGSQQTFTATVNGVAATGVTWAVSCTATGAACGTITSGGVYTAPLAPPSGGGITVTASKTGNISGNAAVTIQYANRSLEGQYAFLLTGQDTTGAYSGRAGSITFDGQGNITGGSEDVAGAGASVAITGGTYHVTTDSKGNGFASLSAQTASGTETWQVTLQNHQHAEAVLFAAGTVASGVLDLQDATQFVSTALNGSYAFLLSGQSGANPANSLHRVGAFAADGVGTLTSGKMDENDFGTATADVALAGTFTAPDANGRGTLIINAATWAYYVVDASHLKLLDTSLSTPAAGEATLQSAGPFDAAGLKASYAVVMAGQDGSGPAAKGALFALDGAGALGGVVDLNSNGNIPTGYSGGASLTGTYTVADAATGRTTMSWTEPAGARTLVLYPIPAGAYVLESDALAVAAQAYQQQTVGFTNSTVAGNFATHASGFGFAGTAGPEAFAGVIAPSGGSALSGTLDLNHVGTTAAGQALSGSYNFASNGRGTASVATPSSNFSSAQMVWYAVNPGRILYLESDTNGVLTGVMVERQ